MSCKAVAWTLLAAIAVIAVLVFNHWAAYQPLSTLAYGGFVLVLSGVANVILPFRFLAIRKRAIGALVLTGGVALTLTALFWPASMIRIAQLRTRLDQIMPEYQFSEKHSARIQARPDQVMQAIRESTFADMKFLGPLLKIRGAVLRAPVHGIDELQKHRILDEFSKAGFVDESEHEMVPYRPAPPIGMFWAWNARANRRPDVHTLQEFAACREQGAVKMGLHFNVEEAGNGWSTVITEQRIAALDDVTSSGMARYWRLIVPGSGLLRLQWLEGIKTRAESTTNRRS
jgi:hypothetical protein